MKRIFVVQHVAHEPLGTLHPLLRAAGLRIRYVNYGRTPSATVSSDGYDGLIVLGGPMGVYETAAYPHLLTEMRLIEETMRAGKPVLGICLGAQLVAATLGARVEPLPQCEIGWHHVTLTDAGRTDPVLTELAPSTSIFQWHGDGFDLPEGAERLATSSACANQAFRYGTNVYGLQFHLEVDEHMIERWLLAPINRAQLEANGGASLANDIRGETAHRIAAMKDVSRRVFGRYIKLFATLRRQIRLGSG